MEAEWDCLAQILRATKILGDATPDIDHIKGHQDDQTDYERLPLPAQLICDTDTLANAYLKAHPTMDYMISNMFPAGEGILHLQQGTITWDIKHACDEARTLPPLKAKII